MVKVNKGVLAEQTFGEEYSNMFPVVANTISGTTYQKSESELSDSQNSIIMFCGYGTTIQGEVKVKKESQNIKIEEGLLKNKSFFTNDIKEIRINESVDCYGAAAFTFGFSLGFKS